MGRPARRAKSPVARSPETPHTVERARAPAIKRSRSPGKADRSQRVSAETDVTDEALSTVQDEAAALDGAGISQTSVDEAAARPASKKTTRPSSRGCLALLFFVVVTVITGDLLLARLTDAAGLAFHQHTGAQRALARVVDVWDEMPKANASEENDFEIEDVVCEAEDCTEGSTPDEGENTGAAEGTAEHDKRKGWGFLRRAGNLLNRVKDLVKPKAAEDDPEASNILVA